MAEASEFVARNIVSLGTMYSATVDPGNLDALETHIATYVLPALVR